MPHALFSHNPEYCVDIIHAHKPAFTPPVRVFGTIGFIVAMWTVSLMGLELSSAQLYIASGASLLLALYALTLPKIPVAENVTSRFFLG